MLKEIKTNLEAHKYDTVIAITGKDANAKIKDQNFVVVIIDINTKSSSAFEVIRFIKMYKPATKIIFTYNKEEELINNGLKEDDLFHLGVNDVLMGPFANNELIKY